MNKKEKYNNTTITLSIPKDTKSFLEKLAVDGYNRSNLMLKMIGMMDILYTRYPQIPLPRGLETMKNMVENGQLLEEYLKSRESPKEVKD